MQCCLLWVVEFFLPIVKLWRSVLMNGPRWSCRFCDICSSWWFGANTFLSFDSVYRANSSQCARGAIARNIGLVTPCGVAPAHQNKLRGFCLPQPDDVLTAASQQRHPPPPRINLTDSLPFNGFLSGVVSQSHGRVGGRMRLVLWSIHIISLMKIPCSFSQLSQQNQIICFYVGHFSKKYLSSEGQSV